MKNIFATTLLSFLLTPFVQQICAQAPELDINKYANSKEAIPISMSGFSGTAQAVLKFDLEVHGFVFHPATNQAPLSFLRHPLW